VSTTSDLLSDLQSAIYETCADMDPDFDCVNAADVEAVRDIDDALAGPGIVAVIDSPDMDWDENRNVTASCTVRVIERFMQNRSGAGTQVAGSAWAMSLAAWLMDADFGEIWSPATLQSLQQTDSNEELLEWAVTFTTRAQTQSEEITE